MRPLLRLFGPLAVVFASRMSAQQIDRARVHPQIPDTTWGRRVTASWQLAFDHRWTQADAAFGALHDEQPLAVEPMLGLGFVARASGRRDEARRWYGAAMAVEPTDEIRRQATDAGWDRPIVLDATGGQAAVNSSNLSQWSAGLVGPITPALSLLARVGAIGGGDPARGIFPDSSTATGARATFVAFGAAVRPNDVITASARVEQWSSAARAADTFLWLDLARRTSARSTVILTVRPINGRSGATRLGLGAELALSAANALVVDAMTGVRDALFEPRTSVRAFDVLALSRASTVRLGLIRDVDARHAATTGLAGTTYMLTPTMGARAEASVRRGAFARSSVDAGLVLRW